MPEYRSSEIGSAMLMAAGLGTRLRPFTESVPKPLLPVMGIPMAQFSVDQLVYSGVTRIVANVHHRAEPASAGLRALDLGRPGQCELSISDESGKLLGSAGGLAKALPLLGDEPFFLLNADVLCEVDLQRLWTRHLALRGQWGVELTLAVFPRGPAGGKYREILLDPEAGLITGLGELEERKPFFVGAAVIEPRALRGVPVGEAAEFVPTVLLPAIHAGKAGAYLGEGQWHDIGSPELWLSTHVSLIRSLESGHLPLLWRRRIEHFNQRLGSELWVENESAHAARKHLSRWAGPAYWSRLAETDTAPETLGPGAVLYGPVPVGASTGAGVGYEGRWIQAGIGP